MTGVISRPPMVDRLIASPVAMAGALLVVAGILQLTGSVLPFLVPALGTDLVAGRAVALLAAGLQAAAGVIILRSSRQGHSALDRVLTASAIVFAAATVLMPVVPWLVADAPAPPTEMYVASTVALALGAVAWVAGLVELIALRRADALRGAAATVPVIAFVVVAVTAALLALVVTVAPDTPQEVLIALWGVQVALAPLLLIATGAVWLASAGWLTSRRRRGRRLDAR